MDNLRVVLGFGLPLAAATYIGWGLLHIYVYGFKECAKRLFKKVTR